MGAVTSWVITIAGVCLISVLVDLCMPDGRVNSTIKRVFSYAVILVVLAPLSNLIGGNFNLELFDNKDIELQDTYIYNINQAKLDNWTSSIDNALCSKGIYGVVVSISADIFQHNMEIFAVYVDLYNVVISPPKPNINIKTEVKGVVRSVVNIGEDKILFYE